MPRRHTRFKKFRTPLSTPYLAKPGEPAYHLCNEPYAYPGEPAAFSPEGDGRPALRILGTTRTERSESTAVLEYTLPSPADAAVDVYDTAGRRVQSLVAGPVARGAHMALFDTRQLAAGQYVCSLRTAGHAGGVPIQVLR